MSNFKLFIILSGFSFFSFDLLSQDSDQSQDKNEPSNFEIFQYRCVGPTRGGRATTVAGVINQPNVYYMGATGGGVWKTEDYGINWKNISDEYFNTPSIGAIRVSPSNTKIVYVGTGSDGIRSNVIAGKGVYKSINSGKSWKHIGLERTGQIGAVEIHPDNPDIVYVAAIGQAFNPNPERGVYRTKDGGESWEHILQIADTVGVSDLEICPSNPNIIYAGAWRAERKPWTIISGGENGGVYRSEDGGDNWQKVENGLPDGLIGKIDFAVTPAAPSRLYALVEAPVGKGGLYISNDYGKSFSFVTGKKELLDRPFYYCNVDADPNNADIVYVNATQYFKSSDAGKSWSRIRTPHGDNHDMWINPDDSKNYIQANDGGANITMNGGKSWSSQMNQPTAELYQVEVDDQYPYRLYAGQQDNSTIMVPSLPPYGAVGGATSFLQAVGGCETGPAVPKPGNPNIVYSNCKGRFGVYDKRTGQEKQYYVGAINIYSHNPKNLKYRFQRVSPIHVSPHNPDVVYHTSQYVHKTTDDGVTWETISPDLTAFTPETQVISGSPITRDITGEEYYSTIYDIRESSVAKGQIWVGANDGPVHVTLNGGKKWKDVTPKGIEPGGRVDCVEPSPHRSAKAYVAILRYQLGDWKPYIYKTVNNGETWTLITTGENGIPADYPTRVVREDPDVEGILYAGTEYGMYISLDDGVSWKSFQQNLPITPITDIKVHNSDLVISTMGRSFWIMDNLSSLHQNFEAQLASNPHLFKPREVYRSRMGGRFASGSDQVPSFPGTAAHIDYFLPEDLTEVITLEILNDKNQVIRQFQNNVAKKENPEDKEPDMATGFFMQGETSSLNAKKGLHRFRWDLRHNGPWDKSQSRSGRNGPLALPGQYTIRLNAGGTILESKIVIKTDPRISGTGISLTELDAQETLSLNIRDLLSSAKKLSEEVQDLQKNIKKSLKENQENKKLTEINDQLSRINKELETSDGRYMKNMLVSQINYLYSMLNRADQMPGKDAYMRYDELKSAYQSLRKDMNKIAKSNIVESLSEE